MPFGRKAESKMTIIIMMLSRMTISRLTFSRMTIIEMTISRKTLRGGNLKTC